MAAFQDKSATEMLNDLIFELESTLLAGDGSRSSSSSSSGDSKANVKNIKEKTSEKKEKEKSKEKVSGESKKNPNQVEKAPLTINSLDLRVGLITNVEKFTEKLYTEDIECGEAEPRKIASGLVPHYSLEEMQNRRLIVVCNLKPRNLAGFKSFGMVLCAAGADGKVEFVNPPPDAKVGDRISGEGIEGMPLSASQCDKQKAFENLAPLLKVDDSGVAMWDGKRLVDSEGRECLAPTVRNGFIS